MKKVLVIGAGFAGISAVKILNKEKNNLQITLIDQNRISSFLPMLPDVIGRAVGTETLSCDIKSLSEKMGFAFLEEKVAAVDLQKKEIKTERQTLDYDYLLIATGSQTNFYGQENIRKIGYSLDSTCDAQRIVQALKDDKPDVFVIAGGGYTGIEIATNLRRRYSKTPRNVRIIIIELTEQILGPLPQWMKDYVGQNLKRLAIETLTSCKVEKAQAGEVQLSNGQRLEKAMLIWTAGVRTADFVFNLNADKTKQGRIKVDPFLRVNDSSFAAGDTAEFSHAGAPLRMAVQFSIAQAEIAANNIINLANGLPLREFRPKDLGYIIPMANNRACGIILGISFRGYFPTIFHYLMCAYRSFSFKNKIGVIKAIMPSLFSGG
ncbi:MAG: FAD-dependent oxidoreductase [Candidatus Omnitrophica bacterium]|nr:FAD-dependent oxidoreductase [Candidatus Omnitrophota bacterium]